MSGKHSTTHIGPARAAWAAHFIDKEYIMLNPFQRACAAVFSGGDFSHVETIQQARDMHDTLFTFLMIELSTSEDCNSRDEAIRRLEAAVADIEQVIEAVRHADIATIGEADARMTSPARTVTLEFLPQSWVNDYAVALDIDHPNRWTIPLSLLLERFPTEQDWRDHDEDRDQMRYEGASPTWIRDWSGPFEIDVADGEDPWPKADTE
ncbi:hypothetical protein CAF53_02460 [Sphingobium sp. LB126]|uniref:hypothetical protein n=1 Tax=Sphingobium sp. LB126 TaxID=1983755 RepID=UPI000C20024C|nr:hypothetical protein [Sphingobium sp. LB126]PJG47228.1 hypothetical protein CAF53_02460 [Sphingobium sp. LB126]